ncbi:MAG: HEAT repeat domain-containing protein [Elusimicrobia bacterium]|nr:HEAT repeat domain-containing protein [Elusimicrobiota bacterium]
MTSIIRGFQFTLLFCALGQGAVGFRSAQFHGPSRPQMLPRQLPGPTPDIGPISASRESEVMSPARGQKEAFAISVARGKSRGLSPLQAKQLAEGTKRQLEELGRREKSIREKFLRDCPSIGSIEAELDYRRAEDPLLLKMNVLERRLRRYRETGVFSLEEPGLDALKKGLFDSWKNVDPAVVFGTKGIPVESLPLDLRELGKYLDRWALYGRQVSQGKSAMPTGKQPSVESLPMGVPVPRRQTSLADKPGFVHDMGTARSEVDPIPALIEQLSSGDPRQRALAADELGMRGAFGSRAVPDLKGALADPDARVRASAVMALGSVAGAIPEVVEDIRRCLRDKNPDVRFGARAALNRIGSR